MATYPGAPPNPLGFKCELNLASIWVDITAYVMLRNQVQITGMGRADESSTIAASQLTLTLKNDGRFTPKNSAGAYYPNILRNTQIRISVNATSGTGVAYSGYRFFGEISAWPPATDISGRDNSVTITASGIWRRITQSAATLGSPCTRYLDQLTGTSVPAAAWAMEDGSGSTVFVTEVGASAAATFTGTPSFAADGTSFPGCDALPQFSGARITGTVTSAATPTDNVVRFALSVPAAGDSVASTFSGGGEVMRAFSPSGTVKRLSVFLTGNQLSFAGWSATTGGSLLFTGTITTKVNGVPVLVSAELTPSGGNIAWALRIIKPGAAAVLDQVTGTYSSGSIAAVTQVFLDDQGRLADTTFGQLGVFYAVPSLVTAAAALSGFAGEFAAVRFQRLCTECGIPNEVIGSTSAAMGPQADDTLANILQSIEDTDGGLLYESTDQFGLGYRTLISLQNQSVAVTLNAAGRQIAPPAPTYDDQLVKNQWTVTNTDGYVAQATLTSGAVSIQAVPNGVGLYAGTANTNASTHAQVNAIAQQRLFVGTVDDVRYPTVSVNLAAPGVAPLFASVPGLRVGDYLQITSLPATIGGSSTTSQLAWGYAETIGGNPQGWLIVFNCVPEAPFTTGYSPGVYSVVQAPTQGVAQGSAVGSIVSASQLAAGAAASGTLSARSIGGVTSFIAAATPYDWTFAVSGTPADATSFICTEVQALPVSAGDTFTNSGGLGGPFTVTTLGAPSGGNVNVYFTPDASSVMSTGTVYGGKNGDTWVNTSAGYQLEQWQAGAWVPIQFGPAALSFTAGGAKVTFASTAPGSPATGDLWYDGPDSNGGYALEQWNGTAWVAYTFGSSALSANSVTTSQILANTILAGDIAAGAITTATLAANAVTAAKIAANTITASQIAAGTILASNIAASQVYAGFVDSTIVQASEYIATNAQGEFLAYSGTPALGNLAVSIAGAAGTDGYTNPYAEGLQITAGGVTLTDQASAPAAVSGASTLFSSPAGRLRFLAASGDSNIIERGGVNVAQFSVGDTTTLGAISGTWNYKGVSISNQSSMFEIEISGAFHTGTSGNATIFQFVVDGAAFGDAITVTGLVAASWFSYTIRFRLAILTSGSGGTVALVGSGVVAIEATIGSAANQEHAVAATTASVAFDTTANHTFQIYGAFNTVTNGTGQQIVTYITRYTEYD